MDHMAKHMIPLCPLLFLRVYGPLGFPSKFPYRSKAIFAFLATDQFDVCFFGMFVNEYGSSCPLPNKGKIYIRYLDSVKILEPSSIRTFVYQEILLGYLDHSRKMGYDEAHVWSCPPRKGDDFIFNCHPQEQVIPSRDHLRKWYINLFERGIKEGVLVAWNTCWKHAKKKKMRTPMDYPYLRGNHWDRVIEELIQQDGMESSPCRKTRTSTRTQHDVIFDKLILAMNGSQSNFFVAQLLAIPTEEIVDPDPVMPSLLLESRESLLAMTRKERLEFSSLRHTQYSTLILKCALHREQQDQKARRLNTTKPHSDEI
ncbi:hypothetical protein L596_001242 [Steinernema carpocapsae]|uniref:histone acetyltransferase n=1 Tax=Steinernema carpocapsae TaxID=34508 RepID=A0A4U8UKG0_STECR|nr:hypothetical protein L596_001242 [Steinernema carpocapsae]